MVGLWVRVRPCTRMFRTDIENGGRTYSVVLRKIEDISLTQTTAEDRDAKLTQAVKDLPIYTVRVWTLDNLRGNRLWVEANNELCLTTSPGHCSKEGPHLPFHPETGIC